MKPLLPVLVAVFILVVRTMAAESQPSESSVLELFGVMRIPHLIEETKNQTEGMMKQLIRSDMQKVKEGLSMKEQRQLDRVAENLSIKVRLLIRDEIKWEKLEPAYMRIYRTSFTQDEIDAMLVFYRSPAGQAVLTKMPAVMKKGTEEAMVIITPLLKKMEKVIDDALAEIRTPPRNSP